MFCNSTLSYITSEYWRYAFGVSMCMISVIGAVENAIVLTVLWKFPLLRTPTNKILASLAVADLLSSLTVAPLHAVQLLSSGLANDCIIESLRIYTSPILVGASAYIIGFVSYDRCLHLRKLQKYKMSEKKLYLILALCWSIAVVIPMVRIIDTIEAKKVYSVLVIINAMLILAVLVTSYAGLLIMLKRHQGDTVNTLNKSRLENERRAVKTVVIIITLYVIMLVPILIYHGLYSMKNVNRQLLVTSYVVGMILAVGNSALNPFIYCYRTPSLKKHMLRFLRVHAKAGTPQNNQDSLMSESNL